MDAGRGAGGDSSCLRLNAGNVRLNEFELVAVLLEGRKEFQECLLHRHSRRVRDGSWRANLPPELIGWVDEGQLESLISDLGSDILQESMGDW